MVITETPASFVPEISHQKIKDLLHDSSPWHQRSLQENQSNFHLKNSLNHPMVSRRSTLPSIQDASEDRCENSCSGNFQDKDRPKNKTNEKVRRHTSLATELLEKSQRRLNRNPFIKSLIDGMPYKLESLKTNNNLYFNNSNVNNNQVCLFPNS